MTAGSGLGALSHVHSEPSGSTQTIARRLEPSDDSESATQRAAARVWPTASLAPARPTASGASEPGVPAPAPAPLTGSEGAVHERSMPPAGPPSATRRTRAIKLPPAALSR